MVKIRLGFVGVGGMGQAAHLANYVCDRNVEVVALAELREGLRKQVAARYGVARTYGDHRELLEREQLDGIVAIQQFVAHGQLIPELFSAGIPVLIEKPIARSINAAEAILAALNKSTARLYVAYHKRSDPATMRAVEQIRAWKQSGAAGAMRYVRLSMPPGDWIANGFSHLLSSEDPYPALASDPAPEGMDDATAKRHDAFVNYYIHQVNLMRHLLGEGYHVRYADPSGVVLSATSDSGVACTLEMQAFRTTRDWQESALVAFEKGWIRLELPPPLAVNAAGRVTIFHDAGDDVEPTTIVPTLPRVHAMRQQAIHFLRAIRGEPTPLCTPAEALADLVEARRTIELSIGAPNGR